MKKMMIALAMVFTLITTTSFAGATVKQEVLNAFKTEFTKATEVNWSVGDTYYKAAFTMNDQKLFAFYSLDGEFLALTRNISSLQLPLNLQKSLKNRVTGQWITDLFEVANGEGTAYYITLESADTKVVLKSVGGSDWTVYKKINKA
jgi:hypothetical protein